VTLVDLPSRAEVDEQLLGFGQGGGGWDGWEDDPGEGWGWSEEPSDDDVPYRRPRVIRALAIVLTFLVITGSVGAYVAVMTAGSEGQYPVSNVTASVPQGSTGTPSAEVGFVVSNQSTTSGRARCTATIQNTQETFGTARAVTGRVPGGGSLNVAIRVPLSSGALAGQASAVVEVACVPARHNPT
jgi:hypothetical protein